MAISSSLTATQCAAAVGLSSVPSSSNHATGGLAVARDALVHLALCFGEMDVHPPAVCFTELAVGADDVRLAGILRMNGKVDADAPVFGVVVLLKQLHRLWDLRVLLHGLVFIKSTARSG